MSKLRAKFFKDDATGQDLLELTILGDPNTLIEKVTPKRVTQFPAEWAAYEQGKAEPEIVGTPMLDVPGMSREMAIGLKLKGVRTAEELAALDEAAAKGLGMGIMTLAKIARNMLAARKLEAIEADRPARRPKAEAQPAAPA